MQTFITDTDFHKIAKTLDNKRLGKQRVEAMQILNTLNPDYTNKGWKHHPAVLMWEGYESTLRSYLSAMIKEWKSRGFKNTIEVKGSKSNKKPWWLCGKLIVSHRSNLIRKNPEFYSQYNWNLPDDIPYYWPVRWNNKKQKIVKN